MFSLLPKVVVVRVAGFSNHYVPADGCLPGMLQIALSVSRPARTSAHGLPRSVNHIRSAGGWG